MGRSRCQLASAGAAAAAKVGALQAGRNKAARRLLEALIPALSGTIWTVPSCKQIWSARFGSESSRQQKMG